MGVKELKKQLFHSKNPFLFTMRQKLLELSFVENLAFHANMDDKEYIKMKYRERFGVEPELENPKNFNEKKQLEKAL